MSFESWSEFLAMGGHGLYVWLSYGAAVIIIAYNVISVQVRQRRYFQQARDQARRAAARGGSEPGAASRAERAPDTADRGESIRS
jgi:heme exporter protein D